MRPEVGRERLLGRHQRREHDEDERREERDRDGDQHAVIRDRDQQSLPAYRGRRAPTDDRGRPGRSGHRGTAWCTHLRELSTITSVTANDTIKQQHRHRRRVAHLEVVEPVLVEQHRVEQRRVVRVAEAAERVACLRRLSGGNARRDIRLREVLQALDHAEDDREQDHRAHRRERHVAHALQRARAVELGGLVEVLRHVEHRSEKDDHHVPDSPEAEQDQRRLRPFRRVEPQRPLDPDLREQDVHRAGRGVEDVDEAERRGDRRRERRQVEDRAEEAGSALGMHEQRRDAEREQHLHRHGDQDHPVDRVLDGDPGLRVDVQQVVVVRPARPNAAA